MTTFTGYKAFYRVLKTNTTFVMHFENPADGPPFKADFSFNLVNMELDGQAGQDSPSWQLSLEPGTTKQLLIRRVDPYKDSKCDHKASYFPFESNEEVEADDLVTECK